MGVGARLELDAVRGALTAGERYLLSSDGLHGVITDAAIAELRQKPAQWEEKELAAAITRTGRLLKPEKDIEDEDRQAKAARSLTKSQGPAGMSLYRVVLDAELMPWSAKAQALIRGRD